MATGLLINTRPDFYRARFHAAFGALGWPIIDCPLLSPAPTDAVFPDPANFDAVIFTSQVAVALMRDARWYGKRVFAVGPGTAEAAMQAGFTDTVQTGVNAEDLARFLAREDFGRALYPSAVEVSADLSLADSRVVRLAVYRMTPRGDLPEEVLAPARRGRPLLIPLFSRRSAETLVELVAGAGLADPAVRLGVVAMSAEVMAAATGPWQVSGVADNPTLDAVVAKTREVAANMMEEAVL